MLRLAYEDGKTCARAHIVSFTETSEAEAVSVTQTRRSESAGYNHCCLPESGDGWPRLGNPEMNGVGRITENKWMRRLRSDLRIVLDLILRSDLRFGPAQNKHLVVRTDGHWPFRASGLLEPLARLAKEGEKSCRASGPAVNVEACHIHYLMQRICSQRWLEGESLASSICRTPINNSS